jgi:hypothetical protein
VTLLKRKHGATRQRMLAQLREILPAEQAAEVAAINAGAAQ